MHANGVGGDDGEVSTDTVRTTRTEEGSPLPTWSGSPWLQLVPETFTVLVVVWFTYVLHVKVFDVPPSMGAKGVGVIGEQDESLMVNSSKSREPAVPPGAVILETR